MIKKQFQGKVKPEFIKRGFLFFCLIVLSAAGLSACEEAPERREESPFQRADKRITPETDVTNIAPLYDYEKWWESMSLVEQRMIEQRWREIPEDERPQWHGFRNRVIHRWLLKRDQPLPPAEEYEIVDGDMPWVIEEILEAIYLDDQLLDGEPQDTGGSYGPYDNRMKSADNVDDEGPAVPLAEPDIDTSDKIDTEEWEIGPNKPGENISLDRNIEEGLY